MEEDGTARRSAAGCPADKHDNIAQQARQRLRDPFVYLFVNEGNETGNLILGLCFPMGPADTGQPPREQGGGKERMSWVGRRKASFGAGPRGCFAESAKR